MTIARVESRTATEEDEPNKIPLQVYGSNLPKHKAHISDAILGFGSNWGAPTPNRLRRVGPEVNNRNFLSWANVCGGYPRPLGTNGENQHCDEYPYNSSSDGGTPAYILGKVSVRLVPEDESQRQGQFIGAMYGNSNGPGLGDEFIVNPFSGGQSGYYDKKGIWHSFN